jgi:hypothetical protein
MSDESAPGYESRLYKLHEAILGCEILEVTGHAWERMVDRGVTEEEVLEVFRRHREVPGKQPPGRKRITWNKDRKTRIDVVYEKGARTLCLSR